MGTTPLSNCTNCGARLEPGANNAARCTYCGSVFERAGGHAAPAPVQPMVEDAQSTDTQPPSQKPVNMGCAFAVMFFVVISFILIEAYRQAGPNNIFAADTHVADSIRLREILEEDKKPEHRKNTNPDPKDFVKQVTFHVNAISTDVYTVVHNYTAHDITYIDLSFQLFDKKHLEIKGLDTHLPFYLINIPKGGTDTLTWSLEPSRKVRLVKVKLKRLEFGNIVWDY